MAPSLSDAAESADSRHRASTDVKEQLWSCVQEASNLDELLDLIEDSGFYRVVLSRSDLLRADVSVQEADFGAILGQLAAFGAILDSRTSSEDDADMKRELAARELSLVSQLGLAKRSVNQLIDSLRLAKNQGRALCLAIVDGAPAADLLCAESVIKELRESRRLLATGCQLPAVIIGSVEADGLGVGGTVTRVDDCDPAVAAAAVCDFASVMLVAYETAAPAAARCAIRGSG